MKYIIIWALFNVHTQELGERLQDKPYREYTAQECSKELMKKGVQRPDKNGNVKLYECIVFGNKTTMQFTEQ